MARRVFFSFHYERDIWRANVVRKSWITKDRIDAGFFDASLWEKAKTKGKEALKKLVRDGLKNTSVTVVLIGAETSKRPCVDFEIMESCKEGKGLLGVYIHQIEDIEGDTDKKGVNPFSTIYTTKNGKKKYLSECYPVYDWVNDDGYNNIGTWIEDAAKDAGR